MKTPRARQALLISQVRSGGSEGRNLLRKNRAKRAVACGAVAAAPHSSPTPPSPALRSSPSESRSYRQLALPSESRSPVNYANPSQFPLEGVLEDVNRVYQALP